MSHVVDLASELIRYGSVSADSNVAISQQIQEWLERWGFDCERVEYRDGNNTPKVNLIARRGSGAGGLGYSGHTDVVPAEDWKFTKHGPFEPTIREGRLFGRGSTDMKGSVACFLAAVEQIDASRQKAPIFICLTADEEVGMQGALHVVEKSQLYREMVTLQTRTIIGEPTAFRVVHAHKGGCAFKVTAHGKAGHSSGTDGVNANWAIIPFLAEMKAIRDELESEPRWRNDLFQPPTMTLNLTINDFTSVINITPPRSVCKVYFRPMPAIDLEPLLERIQECVRENGLDYQELVRSQPMFVPPDSDFVREALEFAVDDVPHTVAYGTDGARFSELEHRIVFGPGSIVQAHTNDESIAVADLEQGRDVYHRMIERWCL